MNTDTSINEISPLHYFQKYFQTSKEILLEPTYFFRTHFALFDLNKALCFGLVSLWLSAAVGFIWDSLNQLFIVRFFERWMQDILLQDEAISFLDFGGKNFLAAAGYVLLNPFLSLIGMAFTATVLFTLAKLFIPVHTDVREKISFSTTMRILAFASTGSWFMIVPFFGGLLSFFAIAILTVIGVRESYGVSTRRSAFIVFLPHILFVCFAMLLLFIAIVGVISFASLPWDIMADL